jgi:hypothetical protein
LRRLFVLLLVLALSACEPAVSRPPESSGRALIGPDTQRELEAVLQRKADAIRRQDLAAFQSTIDLSRAAFRRCWMEAFDESGRGAIPFGALGTRIVKVEPYLDSYVRAYVQDDPGSISRRYFRREGGTWLLSEPRDDELGGARSKTVDGLDIAYWGIDENIVDAIANEGVATRAFLAQFERGPTRQPFAFRVYPTRSATPPQACRAAGTTPLNPADPFIRIFSVWLAPSLTAVSEDTRALLRHEGLHWVQDQFIQGIAVRLDWWLVEGWPDYVANAPRPNTGALICAGRTPPLSELRRGALDDPSTPTELSGQYYSYAHSMVEYLYARFGADSYWAFMSAFKSTMNIDVVYPDVVHESADQFYADWLAWARKKYC